MFDRCGTMDFKKKKKKKTEREKDKSELNCVGPYFLFFCIAFFSSQKELDQGLCHVIELKQMES